MDENARRSRLFWLAGYGAEFLTVLFALAVLAGRVYAQSYWKVFGLSPESMDTAFINYAIMSPSTAIASVVIATSTVIMVAFIREELPDLVGQKNLDVAFFTGFFACLLGAMSLSIIPLLYTPTWTSGTTGLAFGVSYLVFFWGTIIWTQAGFKQLSAEKKEHRKWEISIFRWLKGNTFVFTTAQILFVIVFAAVSLWTIMDTARKFGANEALSTHNTMPIATLQLDSPAGFEGLAPEASIQVRIIAEAGGLLYVTAGTQLPSEVNVRAIPISRVRSIQYSVNITSLDY